MNKKGTILLVFLVAIFGLKSLLSEDASSSSFSYSKNGMRALYELLESSGYNVQRWRQPFRDLMPTSGQILVINSPKKNWPKFELSKWIEAGNAALVIDSSPYSKEFFETYVSGEIIANTYTTEGTFCNTSFPNICHKVRNININEFNSAGLPNSTTILGQDSSAVLNYTIIGKGELFHSSHNGLFGNGMLRDADNARLAFQLLTLYPTILFDEFHHGYYLPTKEKLVNRNLSLKIFAGSFILLLTLFVLSRSLRFGPATWLPSDEHADSTEYSQALGLMYEAHNANDVLSSYISAWKRRCSFKYKVSYLDNDQEFLNLLKNKGVISRNDVKELNEIINEICNTPTESNIKLLESLLNE